MAESAEFRIWIGWAVKKYRVGEELSFEMKKAFLRHVWADLKIMLNILMISEKLRGILENIKTIGIYSNIFGGRRPQCNLLVGGWAPQCSLLPPSVPLRLIHTTR